VVTSLALYEILAVTPKVAPFLLEAFCHTDVDKTKRLNQWRTEGVGWGVQTPFPRNSEVLTKLSRISSSLENTFVRT
jgi:hypothetical protein